MTLLTDAEIRNVNGIANEDQNKIIDFLQGAVYCWCKNRPDEWFALRDLMGGDNTYWKGTPLLAVYEKHSNSPDAFELAGKDAGWLLKKTVAQDLRIFETKVSELVRHYRWVR